MVNHARGCLLQTAHAAAITALPSCVPLSWVSLTYHAQWLIQGAATKGYVLLLPSLSWSAQHMVIMNLFFCRTHSHVLFWDHWYPYFGFLVMYLLDFKARMGFALFVLWRQMYCTFPEIHLWCYTLPTSWWTALQGINQVHILPKDITGTSEALTHNHVIMSSML